MQELAPRRARAPDRHLGVAAARAPRGNGGSAPAARASSRRSKLSPGRRGWSACSEIASNAVLAVVGLAHLDAGDLGDGVPLVGRLQRAGEQVLLAHRLRRKLAGRCSSSRGSSSFVTPLRQAASMTLRLDQQVVADEVRRVGVVGEDAADLGRREEHVRRAAPRAKNASHRRLVAQVELALRAQQRGSCSPLAAAAARSPSRPARGGRRRRSRSSLFMVADSTLKPSLLSRARRVARARGRLAHHLAHQLVEADLAAPSRASSRALRRVAEQRLDLGRPEVARIDRARARGRSPRSTPCSSTPSPRHSIAYAELGAPPRSTNSRTRVLLAGGDDEVLRLVLLQHQPLRLDVVAGMAPVAQGVEVAEVQAVLEALR